MNRRGIRSRTRRAALQALYQWQMTGHSAEELHAQFSENRRRGGFDPVFFDALVGGVIIDFEALDAEIAAFADRPVAELDPVERAILRMGTHELRSMADIPWRTVPSTRRWSSPAPSGPSRATSTSTACSTGWRAACGRTERTEPGAGRPAVRADGAQVPSMWRSPSTPWSTACTFRATPPRATSATRRSRST